MTLPTDVNFSRIEEGNEKDSKELIRELQDMYENVAQNVNGFIRNNTEIDQANWTPTLNGSTPGTFTYTNQIGWSIRQGIFTHIWFDITWSATTAAGNLYLELPYIVSISNGMPFVGTVQASNVAYLGNYLVINAIPNTYRGEFFSVTPAAVTSNLTVPASGRLIGYLFYIGLEDE